MEPYKIAMDIFANHYDFFVNDNMPQGCLTFPTMGNVHSISGWGGKSTPLSFVRIVGLIRRAHPAAASHKRYACPASSF